MNNWSIILTAFISLITGLFLGIIADQYFLFQLNDWAKLGDASSGIIGVIISLTAVILIWKTYNFQKEELNKTSEIVEFQNKTQIFLELVKRKDNIIDSINLNGMEKLKFFTSMTNTVKKKYKNHSNLNAQDRITKSIKESIGKHSRPIIKRYLSVVVSIVNLISTIEISEEKDKSDILTQIFNDTLLPEEKNFLKYYLFFTFDKHVIEFLYRNEIIDKLSENIEL